MTDTPASDDRAGWEGLFRSGIFPPRYQTTAAPNASVAEWAATLPAGAYVLDVGCGIGRHALYLGERGFRMAGIDVSPTGVSTTQQVCAERGIAFDGNVAPMTAIPWEDMTFDAALSTSTISHNRLADIQKTLDEIWRVLKPGGTLLVDFPHKNTRAYQQVRDQVSAGTIIEVEPETYVDDSAQPDDGNDAFLPHHYTDEDELRMLMQRYEILRLWTEFLGETPDGAPAPRGYWVIVARRPFAG